MYVDNTRRFPIKIWLPNPSYEDSGWVKQAHNLADLPFIHKWVAIMPDVHEGFGMPIGGVIATRDVIIPNAVGVDIGCGVVFQQTNIPVSLLKQTKTPDGTLLERIVDKILAAIPTGFDHHKKAQQCEVYDNWRLYLNRNAVKEAGAEIWDELEDVVFQISTLGGGNHFIEIQEDEEGKAALMVHTGSRHFGYQIHKYFNKIAEKLNREWGSDITAKNKLAYLPVDTPAGDAYINWMNLALRFARENRAKIMARVREILLTEVEKYTSFTDIELEEEINAHHNYAALEHHYGEHVWVHRKGAIRAGKGELGIIPGAMGSYSYIVEGLGNPESFCSCSHGAGRVMSRREAKREIPVDETLSDLKDLGVVLGKTRMGDVSEESRFSYKDIDFVLSQETDLVRPIKRLKTVGVIKG